MGKRDKRQDTKQKRKELTDCDILVAVFSNHSDLHHLAETFHVPCEVFRITTENKEEQENIQIEDFLLKNNIK